MVTKLSSLVSWRINSTAAAVTADSVLAVTTRERFQGNKRVPFCRSRVTFFRNRVSMLPFIWRNRLAASEKIISTFSQGLLKDQDSAHSLLRRCFCTQWPKGEDRGKHCPVCMTQPLAFPLKERFGFTQKGGWFSLYLYPALPPNFQLWTFSKKEIASCASKDFGTEVHTNLSAFPERLCSSIQLIHKNIMKSS